MNKADSACDKDFLLELFLHDHLTLGLKLSIAKLECFNELFSEEKIVKEKMTQKSLFK